MNATDSTETLDEVLASALRAGVRVEVGDNDSLHITAPPGALTPALRERLRAHKAELTSLLRNAAPEERQALKLDRAARFQPFPLTDLQHAFWLGRSGAFELGNVATHFYLEFDCDDLDVERLNRALQQVIARNDMLRTVVMPDGLQRLLTTTPPYVIAVDDIASLTAEAAEQRLLATRDELSHQVLQPDQWPLFEVRATRMSLQRARLHVSLDLLVLDAWSILLFFRQWHAFYQDNSFDPPPLLVSFRDYVLAERAERQSAAYQRDYAYWMNRIEGLPGAPALPLRRRPAAAGPRRFTRREALLPRRRLDALKSLASARGISPSAIVLAAYAEVIARWSASPHFSLNVTSSHRRPVHPQVNELLGDFSSVVMLEVDRRDASICFGEFARAVHLRLTEDLQHQAVSGLVVLREWSRRQGGGTQALLPVVFSSGLIWSGAEGLGNLEYFGSQVYGISQTSQVWLDHHVLEQSDGARLIWDSPENMFEPGVLDAMFDAYQKLLVDLADNPPRWDEPDLLTSAVAHEAERASSAIAVQPSNTRLHAGLIEHAAREPKAPALICRERVLSYGALLAEATYVADQLQKAGIEPQEPVAVLMHRGWEQVVAVYGILLAGGAYLPVDSDLPLRRQQDVLTIGRVRHVLTQPDVNCAAVSAGRNVTIVRPENYAPLREAHVDRLRADPNALAYVIFTSGTTAVPKGVMIDHAGAMNTIEAINEMLAVGPSDRIVAVSALSFDLSVYDIFGMHKAGAAVVLPGHGPLADADEWRRLIPEHRVTLWNSAPQLMRMLMDSHVSHRSSSESERLPSRLRAALLSGDFIPVDLPEAIANVYPGAKVIGLGGATEASIWSIYYPIDKVDSAWSSIPYGRALRDQSVSVRDAAMRACPDFVQGKIYIGGRGLAIGYWDDPDKTASRFVRHPVSGERLYDTGDLGYRLADGDLVILGREDGQVKIRGHRIETGEIETIALQYPGARACVVVAVDAPGRQKYLVAFVERSRDCAVDAAALCEHIAGYVPDYMIPKQVVFVDHMPLSANGKVDRRQLLQRLAHEPVAARQTVAPRTDLERMISEVWHRVIGESESGVTDSFFDLGGDSVLATELIRELNAVLPLTLEIHELFENPTIEGLARLCDSAENGQARQRGALGDDGALQAEAASMIEAVHALDWTGIANGREQPTAQAILVTGATGFLGGYVVAELLQQTDSQLVCLVRAAEPDQAQQRIADSLENTGIALRAGWQDRLQVVCGDLTEERWGLTPQAFEDLSSRTDAVYHLAASVSVIADFASHKKVNVAPLIDLFRIALHGGQKRVFLLSPFAVCTRHRNDELEFLGEEQPLASAEGLLSGYSQSKWVAEQVALAAASRGLGVRIWRASHALPAARDGRSGTGHSTHDTVLMTAARAGVIPQWTDSALHGVPVDILARLLVESSLDPSDHRGIIHIENHHPSTLREVVEILLRSQRLESPPAHVSSAQWHAACVAAAASLPNEQAALSTLLFSKRGRTTGVETMFSPRRVETRYFERAGQSAKLDGLTPPAYWEQVFRQASWSSHDRRL